MFETKHAGILMCPLVRITLQSNCLLCLYRTLHKKKILFLQKDLQLLEHIGKLIPSFVVSCDGLDGMQSNSKSNPLGWVNETLDALH